LRCLLFVAVILRVEGKSEEAEADLGNFTEQQKAPASDGWGFLSAGNSFHFLG